MGGEKYSLGLGTDYRKSRTPEERHNGPSEMLKGGRGSGISENPMVQRLVEEKSRLILLLKVPV